MSRDPVRKFPIAPILRSFGAEVGDYRSGRQKILCPFHDDSRPSAQVDFARQRFICWACGVHGDALDLLRSQEGLSFGAAVNRAEALVGDAPTEVRPAQEQAPSLFERPRAGRGSY